MYKIVENPQNVLYFPASVKMINSITVKAVDQNGETLKFREDTIDFIEKCSKMMIRYNFNPYNNIIKRMVIS